jgi:hypothetical protein
MVMAAGASNVALVFSAVMLVWAAGVGLWYVTHLRRRAPEAPPPTRAERRSAWRRAIMVFGLVLLAAAFFYGVNFLRFPHGDERGAVAFVAYWSAVVVLLLALLLLALVDLYLLRRAEARKRRDALTRSFRRPNLRTRDDDQRGSRDGPA